MKPKKPHDLSSEKKTKTAKQTNKTTNPTKQNKTQLTSEGLFRKGKYYINTIQLKSFRKLKC